jgi:hypothetical protein
VLENATSIIPIDYAGYAVIVAFTFFLSLNQLCVVSLHSLDDITQLSHLNDSAKIHVLDDATSIVPIHYASHAVFVACPFFLSLKQFCVVSLHCLDDITQDAGREVPRKAFVASVSDFNVGRYDPIIRKAVSGQSSCCTASPGAEKKGYRSVSHHRRQDDSFFF